MGVVINALVCNHTVIPEAAWCWYCGLLFRTVRMAEVGEQVYVCRQCKQERDSLMEAERIYPNEEGHLLFPPRLSYGQEKDGTWYFKHPDTGLGSLAGHEVLEHEDGTITVAPSIQITSGSATVHGYLVGGHWRDC